MTGRSCVVQAAVVVLAILAGVAVFVARKARALLTLLTRQCINADFATPSQTTNVLGTQRSASADTGGTPAAAHPSSLTNPEGFNDDEKSCIT